MAKIHARMSVEFDVPDDVFNNIVESAKDKHGNICDVEIPLYLGIKPVPSDWDDGGYVPGPWLEEDIRSNKLEVKA